jgi:N-acetylmuramoyl-L-alanine amidase
MSIDPRRPGENRQAILRGVYDDNLNTVRGTVPRVPETKRRFPTGMARGIPVLIGVLLLLAGLHYHVDAANTATAAQPRPATAGELQPGRVAQSGSFLPADPEMRAVADRTPLGGSAGDATVASLYGLRVRTIVIDPGHGGNDPGTIGKSGLMEKDVTLDVARRLRARLERDPSYQILMTRDEDVRVPLRSRVAFANEHRADLFISVHVNWLPVDSIAPIETFYYGPGSDAKTRQLAARENQNSGFTLAEFNEMTQRLGLSLKIQESKEAAISIQRSLYRNVKRLDGNASDWGARSGDFLVLLGTEAPSVLVEIANISNRAEEAKLNTPEHRERLAMFLEEGIVNYLRQHSNESGSTAHAIKAEK